MPASFKVPASEKIILDATPLEVIPVPVTFTVPVEIRISLILAVPVVEVIPIEAHVRVPAPTFRMLPAVAGRAKVTAPVNVSTTPVLIATVTLDA